MKFASDIQILTIVHSEDVVASIFVMDCEPLSYVYAHLVTNEKVGTIIFHVSLHLHAYISYVSTS